MCGIVGAISTRNVINLLLQGLQHLEYRGYDSAGLATIDNQQLLAVKRVGKVRALAEAVRQQAIKGVCGIAHTRWATHGVPSENNAHPHVSGNLAIVHNGIIENFQLLKQQLQSAGYTFNSDTDSEVIVHLIHSFKQQGHELAASVRLAVQMLEGAFALGVIDQAQPEQIVAIRRGSPLIIGVGVNETFIASDHLALLPVTQQFIYLDDCDMAILTTDAISMVNQHGEPVQHPIVNSSLQYSAADKGQYSHYMIKEIYEQPEAINQLLASSFEHNQINWQVFGDGFQSCLQKIKRIQIVACGTSYHAGCVARYWFEQVIGISCQVEIASEFRYRSHVVEDRTLFITLSQSGETADTLEALRKAKYAGYYASLAICNVPESSLIRESDYHLLMRSGPEIGVASTKAFTSQLVALQLLLIACCHVQNREYQQLVQNLRQLSSLCESTLMLDKSIQVLSASFTDKHHCLFLGRGSCYPIAMEGALKLKEISYIHAEAYPAGELKHGPLALVNENMPIVVVAPNNELIEKLLSNIHEVKARGGQCIVFADESLQIDEPDITVIDLPSVDPLLAPIIYTLPMQLLSYHVAVIKGTDVDQPRNLAKSVTVE